jgi:hypothetical protein
MENRVSAGSDPLRRTGNLLIARLRLHLRRWGKGAKVTFLIPPANHESAWENSAPTARKWAHGPLNSKSRTHQRSRTFSFVCRSSTSKPPPTILVGPVHENFQRLEGRRETEGRLRRGLLPLHQANHRWSWIDGDIVVAAMNPPPTANTPRSRIPDRGKADHVHTSLNPRN